MYIRRFEGKAEISKELLLGDRCTVALGNFDGLHLGHMLLVRKAVSHAQKERIKSCVLTFTSNLGGAPYITSNEQREKLLSQENVDYFLMCKFTEEFKSLEPESFFKNYIVDFLKAKLVVVGFNYRFGHKARGDGHLLKKLCGKYNVGLVIVNPVLYRGAPISSTRIRESIEAGNITDAKNMLGRDFSVMGTVIAGDGIGKGLGFPTANLSVDKSHVMPPRGVYATKTYVDDREYVSITNYGGKPTIKDDSEFIETHLLNFGGGLYGKKIEVAFIKKMRDIKAFTSREELSRQLAEDKILREREI